MRNAVLLAATLLTLSCRTVGVAREEGGYAQVSPTIAHEMMLDTRQIPIVDVRSAADYLGPQGHIAGAISAPLDSIEYELPELLPHLGETLIVYGDSQEEGVRGARLLAAAGFRSVVLIQGGIRRWIELGYKTVTSD